MASQNLAFILGPTGKPETERPYKIPTQAPENFGFRFPWAGRRFWKLLYTENALSLLIWLQNISDVL
jgi:hypothetical protein